MTRAALAFLACAGCAPVVSGTSSPPPSREVIVCAPLARAVPELAAVLKGDGDPPEAITLGRTRFYFVRTPSAALRCHEAAHVAQRDREGPVRFELLYLHEHALHGYQGNRFEVEARAAEALPCP